MSEIRHRFTHASLLAIAFLSLGLITARDARATLGGDVRSVAENEETLAATRTVKKLAAGERHELTLPSGIVIHEYLSATGSVYAITWRGPRVPNLRELLGPYFAQLTSRDPSLSPGGHHHLRFQGEDFEIRGFGHLHSFSGRAWVPSLVPANVRVDGLD